MHFAQAVVYERYGHPAEVLKLSGLPRLPLIPGEVRIRLLAAPIHPSDFGMINGSYGRLAELPAVAGREGVGEIVELGSEVKGWKVGSRVAFLPEAMGTWQEYITLKETELVRLPIALHLLQSAMALINPPTAWLLLENFATLAPGDWVIQNGANSAVGQLVIQLAKLRGLKTLNVVRDLSQAAHLAALGAHSVVAEGSPFWRDLPSLTGGAPIRLALNSIGGTSAITLMRSLTYGGTMVTFGGISPQLVKFPTKPFIFNDIRLVGFWWDNWRRTAPREKVMALYAQLLALMEEGSLHIPVDKVYPLDAFQAAVLHAEQGGRSGKILLMPLDK